MAKVQIISDIHLEFMKKDLWTPNFLEEDILVLAGDIQVGFTQENWFVNLLEHRNCVYILGNHEFYGYDFDQIIENLPVFVKNVNLLAEQKGFKYRLYGLQNQTIDINDVRFIGCTLWTDFKKNDPFIKLIGQRGMSDYNVIKKNGRRLNPDDIYDEHIQSVKFLEQELSKDDGIKKFVVTHHLPSYESVHPTYRNYNDADFNYMYFSDSDYLVEKADFWLHGHTHTSADYFLGKCQVICNPRGYQGYDLNKTFKDIIIDV